MPTTGNPDLIAGRYRLDRLLGRGGMGEVRAGVDLRLDRDIAVKLLRDDLAHQPELRERFEREARAAARISHPNVVAVFDTGEQHGVPYIVMERLPGETLGDEMRREQLSQARACTLILEVLSALEAAHQLGILHRDIKPGNILVSRDGHAKVADFGIAKIADDTDPRTTGILFGTAEYLAPERLAGEPASPQSDLYSVGVLFFEALAGRPPFQAETPLGLAASIAGDDPPPLAELRPDLAPAVIATIQRAMERNPTRRFATASAMTGAVTAAIDTSIATDALPTAPVPAARPARPTRNPTPVAATEVLAQAPPEVATTSSVSRSKRHVLRWSAAALALVATVAVVVAVLVSNGGDTPSSPPGSQGSTTSSAPIPTPLRQAIDELDEAVQP